MTTSHCCRTGNHYDISKVNVDGLGNLRKLYIHFACFGQNHSLIIPLCSSLAWPGLFQNLEDIKVRCYSCPWLTCLLAWSCPSFHSYPSLICLHLYCDLKFLFMDLCWAQVITVYVSTFRLHMVNLTSMFCLFIIMLPSNFKITLSKWKMAVALSSLLLDSIAA